MSQNPELHIHADADAVAAEAALRIAREAREAIASRGRFLLAVSGGRTPWVMLRALARETLPWDRVHVFQVDERVAPDGHADRNLTHLRASLLPQAALPEANLHPMPVTDPDPNAAAVRYAVELEGEAGRPPVLDLVHLGMGADGHTASLIPGDAALGIRDAEVAVCGVYQGRQRLTLTYPVIDRARRILWVVTGAEKAPMLTRLLAGDRTIPAGVVARDRAVILADRDAAAAVA